MRGGVCRAQGLPGCPARLTSFSSLSRLVAWDRIIAYVSYRSPSNRSARSAQHMCDVYFRIYSKVFIQCSLAYSPRNPNCELYIFANKPPLFPHGFWHGFWRGFWRGSRHGRVADYTWACDALLSKASSRLRRALEPSVGRALERSSGRPLELSFGSFGS